MEEEALKFGLYEVIFDGKKPTILGSGDLGVTYLARHVTLKRENALKLIKGANASISDAQALSKLSHENVVSIVDAFPHDDGLCVAMERLMGPTLREYLDSLAEKGRSIPLAKALTIVNQAASGLDAAWTQVHLIHRDIKPENAILTENLMTLKLIDFGSIVQGTADYSCLEQLNARTEISRPDPSWDTYALGSMLWEMLTGVPPFQDEDRSLSAEEIIDRKKESDPPFENLHEFPNPVQRLLRRMLSRDPSKRIREARGLLDILPEVMGATSKKNGKKRTVRVAKRPAIEIRSNQLRNLKPIGSTQSASFHQGQDGSGRLWNVIAAPIRGDGKIAEVLEYGEKACAYEMPGILRTVGVEKEDSSVTIITDPWSPDHSLDTIQRNLPEGFISHDEFVKKGVEIFRQLAEAIDEGLDYGLHALDLTAVHVIVEEDHAGKIQVRLSPWNFVAFRESDDASAQQALSSAGSTLISSERADPPLIGFFRLIYELLGGDGNLFSQGSFRPTPTMKPAVTTLLRRICEERPEYTREEGCAFWFEIFTEALVSNVQPTPPPILPEPRSVSDPSNPGEPKPPVSIKDKLWKKDDDQAEKTFPNTDEGYSLRDEVDGAVVDPPPPPDQNRPITEPIRPKPTAPPSDPGPTPKKSQPQSVPAAAPASTSAQKRPFHPLRLLLYGALAFATFAFFNPEILDPVIREVRSMFIDSLENARAERNLQNWPEAIDGFVEAYGVNRFQNEAQAELEKLVDDLSNSPQKIEGAEYPQVENALKDAKQKVQVLDSKLENLRIELERRRIDVGEKLKSSEIFRSDGKFEEASDLLELALKEYEEFAPELVGETNALGRSVKSSCSGMPIDRMWDLKESMENLNGALLAINLGASVEVTKAIDEIGTVAKTKIQSESDEAISLADAKDWERALKSLEALFEVAPNDSKVETAYIHTSTRMASFLEQYMRYNPKRDESLCFSRQAVNLLTGLVDKYHNNTAAWLVGRVKDSGRASWLEKASAAGHGDSSWCLGLLEMQQGGRAEALKYYEASYKQQSIEGAELLAEALLEDGAGQDVSRALSIAEELVLKDASNSNARFLKGLALMKGGDIKSAKSELENAVGYGSVEAHSLLGNLLMKELSGKKFDDMSAFAAAVEKPRALFLQGAQLGSRVSAFDSAWINNHENLERKDLENFWTQVAAVFGHHEAGEGTRMKLADGTIDPIRKKLLEDEVLQMANGFAANWQPTNERAGFHFLVSHVYFERSTSQDDEDEKKGASHRIAAASGGFVFAQKWCSDNGIAW